MSDDTWAPMPPLLPSPQYGREWRRPRAMDEFGNITARTRAAGGGGQMPNSLALVVSRATNQLAGAGYAYDVLGNLGYVRHPGLKDGRVNNLVRPDGARSVLYVAKGRMDLLALAGAEAARSYTEAQTVA